MAEISIVIVEDEMLIAKSLSLSLEERGYEVRGVVDNAEEALKLILAEKPDTALLDIQLKGEKSGIWLAEQLKSTLPIPYIFLTSFRDKETVSQAIKTMPYGYLMKPVDEANLDAAIALAFERYGIENQVEGKEDHQFVINDAIFLKDDHYFIKLKFEDILFVKASGNYIEILENERKHVLKSTLKRFTSSIPQDRFFQCHRSYVVNLQKVDKIGYKSLFINKTEVPMVKENREDLLSRLQYFSR